MARIPTEAMAPKKPPAPVATTEPRPVQMTVQIANAILTHAPLNKEQLDCARAHYKLLAELTIAAGPRFANARRDAIDMHNRVVRWINGAKEEERRRKMVDDEERLLEITV